jgi:phosphomannomutase
VRASNTEPIVRLIVEAPTPAAAEQLCAAAAETLSPFA